MFIGTLILRQGAHGFATTVLDIGSNVGPTETINSLLRVTHCDEGPKIIAFFRIKCGCEKFPLQHVGVLGFINECQSETFFEGLDNGWVLSGSYDFRSSA